MRKNYEKPVVEILSFDVKESTMASGELGTSGNGLGPNPLGLEE